MKRLKYEPYLSSTQPRELVFTHSGYILLIDEDLACSWRVQSRYQPKKS